jgi:hypothetical protein
MGPGSPLAPLLIVPRPLRSGARMLLALAPLFTFSGCMTVYQPMMSLQRPVAVDPQDPNFKGQRLLVRCIPGEWADPGESQTLCQNVSTLFSNQGAKVDVEIPGETFGEDDEHEAPAVRAAQKARAPPSRPDLIIELSARRLAYDNTGLNWFLCWATLTLIPAVTDVTFAQDVVVKDADGFLLVQDSLQARFIRYFGFGVWAINGLADLIVRSKEEKLLGDAPRRDFSHDFHEHLSQLALTATVRERVLHNFHADTPAAGQ